MQEHLDEEQKKTSGSYLFSYYNEQVDCINKWETGSLAPSFWGTGSTQVDMLFFFFVQGKPTNPAIQTCTKNTLFENYFNVDIHTVEWFHNHQNINREIKTVGFQKTDVWLERDTWRPRGSYCCRDIKTLLTSLTEQWELHAWEVILPNSQRRSSCW